ncbi:hypothetical protein C2U70_08265 [Bradyrhizobium guangdongense]|nr:hypothetical protein C2U70_08265 [Bradyrhizobium guangdongense]
MDGLAQWPSAASILVRISEFILTWIKLALAERDAETSRRFSRTVPRSRAFVDVMRVSDRAQDSFEGVSCSMTGVISWAD